MNIEKVQKINRLARELVQHGMASSMEEAVNKAEQTLKTEKEMTVIKEKMKPVEESKYLESALIRKLSNMVEQQRKQIEELQNKVKQLFIVIDELKKSKSEEKKPEIKEESHVKVPEEKQTVFKKEEKEKPHPKVGSYKPNDVDIEKIFYYGQK